MLKYILLSSLIHILIITSISLILENKLKEKTHFNNTYLKLSLTTFTKENKKQIKTPTTKNRIPSELNETPKTDYKSNQDNSKNNEEYPIPKDDIGNMIPPKLIYSPNITYPIQAKIRNIEGSVYIEITISTNGRVTKAQIIKSSEHQILDYYALEYVKNILFSPAKNKDGNPIEVKSTYIVHFILK